MKSLNPRTRKLGINIDHLTAKDPKAARLMDELKLLHQAPRVDPEVREKHLALLETVNRALAPTPRGQNDRERGGTSMNTEQPGYSAIFDPFAGPVLPHPRPSRLSSLGRAARNVMAGLTVCIGLAAGGVTIVHYVWGSNPPMPIPVVKVTVSVAQPSGHTVPPAQHGSIGAASTSLRAKPAVQPAWHPVTQWFGRTNDFNHLVGADPVSSVTIVGQAFTVPDDPNQTAGTILRMYTDSSYPEGSQAQFNNDLLGGHTLRLTLGCDDSSSIGASTTVRVRNQNGQQLFKTDVQQGQPATASRIDLGADTHVVTIWATPASSGCSLGIPFPAVR